MGMLPDKIFHISYNDLTSEAQARYDQFVRDCGGNENDVANERATSVLGEITEDDLDIHYSNHDDTDDTTSGGDFVEEDRGCHTCAYGIEYGGDFVPYGMGSAQLPITYECDCDDPEMAKLTDIDMEKLLENSDNCPYWRKRT